MTLRAVREDDVGLIKPMLQLGFPKVDWTDEMAREWLSREGGVQVVDPGRRAYLRLSINPDLEDDIGFGTGLCTLVFALLPQHHDQKWVDDVLAPLLASGLTKIAEENPKLRERPVYAFLTPDLLPFWAWTGIFNAETTARSTGSHVLWLPTLRETIAKVARF